MDAESLKVKNPELLEYCGPTSAGGLIMRIASSPLVWTDAKPTVPGPFWVEDGGEEVVTVFEIDGELRVHVPGVRGSINLDEFCRRASGRRLRFAGPIQQPEEPR